MKLKDPLSGAFHFGGALLSATAIVLLVFSGLGDPWKIVSFSIYGSTLLFLYSSSTLYHWLPIEADGKYQFFRKLDHTSIYLLIAGTYTPFCLVTLRGAWGWSLFGIVWGLAAAGILIKYLDIKTGRWIRTLLYVGMGWIAVIAIRPIWENLPLNGIYLLVTGGLAYSIGGIAYAAKKPNFSKHFGFHELWHLFVLLGSFLHFLCVLLFV